MSTLLFNNTLHSGFTINSNILWTDPESTLSIVTQQLKGLKTVGTDDRKINLASWNAEYLWALKANHFISSYKEIVSRHHLLALQEVSSAGLATISAACGYNYFVSSVNSRGQAVGFLVHPRFVVTNTQEYSQVAEVFNIHDLRPALRIDVLDQISNMNLSIITVHLKSMIGGISATSAVRKKQIAELALACNNILKPVIIVGDFNCFLDSSEDIYSLVADQFVLANPANHSSTQMHGGRLDGLMYKNFVYNSTPKHYNIRNFWQTGIAGRSLSDHGLLTWSLAHQ